MNDTLNLICAHVVDTLPDSIAERRGLLRALRRLLGDEHPALPRVLDLLQSLETASALQLSLSGDFRALLAATAPVVPGPAPTLKRDLGGDGDGDAKGGAK